MSRQKKINNKAPKGYEDWDQYLNVIRGKNLGGQATKRDVSELFRYIDTLNAALDDADCHDTFGTEGWRRFILNEDE